MHKRRKPRATAGCSQRGLQQGVVLISTMLLLLVLTIFALSMFRSYGLQDKIAGNVREKQRALHSAIGAQSYAETFLSQLNSGTPPLAVPCTAGVVPITSPTQVKICNNPMSPTVVATVPWINGFAYTASIHSVFGAAGTVMDTLVQPPQFYIYDLGPNGWGELYQVDAFSYGGTNGTVAVVESTYNVANKSNDTTQPGKGG